MMQHHWPWLRSGFLNHLFDRQYRLLIDSLPKGLRLDLKRVLVSSRADLLTNFLSLTLAQSPDPSYSELTDRALPRIDFSFRLSNILNSCCCFSPLFVLIWMLPMHLQTVCHQIRNQQPSWYAMHISCKADRILCASSASQYIPPTDINQILSPKHKYPAHFFVRIFFRFTGDGAIEVVSIGIPVHFWDIIGFGVWILWEDDDKNRSNNNFRKEYKNVLNFEFNKQ